MDRYGPLAALNVDWRGSPRTDPPYALYFFRQREYIRWDIDREQLFAGYPRPIAEGWPGLAEVFPGVPLCGAMQVPPWQDRIYFFFRGQREVACWDIASHRLEPRRLPIAELLPGELTADGQFTPLYVDDGATKKIYVFRADTYARWTLGSGGPGAPMDADYPRKIGDGWTGGLTIAPRCAVSVNWPRRSSALTNHKIYFFLGDLYTRWDVKAHRSNYRLDIPSGWKGWPAFD